MCKIAPRMNNFSKQICDWYQLNKRNLPWRNTQNAYFIWLSEIILQQTRVNQGMAYYLKFVKNFPTVKKLAHARTDKVMKLWQGLGYYSRARHLHETAKNITENYDGIFPADYTVLKNLKGVGEYTAAAIASFAYNLPYPVIDGNVYRVLARIFGIEEPIDTAYGKKLFRQKANNLLNKNNPAIHNQAIMEFGALQCIPKNPDCYKCVFKNSCVAFQTDKVNQLPAKQQKINIKKLYFYYAVIKQKNNYFLKKRTDNSIWKYLYDFPLIESNTKISDNIAIKELTRNYLSNTNCKVIHISHVYSHLLSHRKIEAKFYLFDVSDKKLTTDNWVVQHWKKTPQLAVPRLIEKYLTDIFAFKL